MKKRIHKLTRSLRSVVREDLRILQKQLRRASAYSPRYAYATRRVKHPRRMYYEEGWEQ